jgi:hypothetical protein
MHKSTIYQLLSTMTSFASATGLSTVSRKSMLSYGNTRFLSGYLPNPSTSQYEILQDGLRQGDYLMHQKFLESVGWGQPHRWVKYKLKKLFLLYIT